MKNKVLAALHRAWPKLNKNGELFLAVSGGMDSMLLMEAVRRYLPDPKKRVHVLHVNHHLRGKESDADEALVKKGAHVCGFAFHSLQIDWENEKPSQASSRKKREEFYASLLKENDSLFLAHHLDDQAETIFLRLLRGTGLRGLAGMKLKNGKKIRPFLSLTKKELEVVAKDWKISWREDASNQSNKYERNWIRNEILPLLEKRRPGVNKKLAAVAADLAEFPKTNANTKKPSLKSYFFHKDVSGFEVWRKDTLKISPAELSEIFSLNRQHTNDLIALLQKNSGQSTAEGIRFSLSSGYLLVERGEAFSKQVLVSNKQNQMQFQTALGTWQFIPEKDEEWGMRSSFSLGDKGKKIFQEEKIPQFFREHIPICRKQKKIYLATPKFLRTLDKKNLASIHYQPTKLAEWFFTPSS